MLTGIPVKKNENKEQESKDQADSFATIEEIEEQAQKRFIEASSKQKRKVLQKDSEIMMMARKEFIDPRDQINLRRPIGKNDLLPISYLQTGLRMSESVCRIVVRDSAGNKVGTGTGFLVSPEVLITNNHVLPSIDFATNSVAEFNYQQDENFAIGPVYRFSLNPDKFFLTNKSLDFTLLSVNPTSQSGENLKEIPYIELKTQPGAILEEESVSIIQHPDGPPTNGLKSITVRENQVRFLIDDFIQYTTDTNPGSSGSPVFNDQWIVVALHHSGVRDPNDKHSWIANEGIRISSIAAFVKNEYHKANEETQDILEGIFKELKELRKKEQEKRDENVTKGENVYQVKADQYRDGYDPLFLGEDFRIDLPRLSREMEEDSTRMDNGSNVLDYVHFSIVMCQSRGLAYFTAVNIDGTCFQGSKRGTDRWALDSRIKRSAQYGNKVYVGNKLDKGHLVRRLDPVWGDKEIARQADADTFFYTNCAPQHKDLNQKTWLDLEGYILDQVLAHNLKISVFTGPVLNENFIEYREIYKIPVEFWKVVAMVKEEDKSLSVTAYLQSQDAYMGDLEFASDEVKTYQVPIATIEERTGLDFGNANEFNPVEDIESSGFVITEPKDIRL